MASLTDTIATGIEFRGTEVGVRATSQHSRRAHKPKTDDDGRIVFVDRDGNRVDADHEAARPVPECDDYEHDTDWQLKAVGKLTFRDKCGPCFDADRIATQNSVNAKSKSFARVARYGSDWGDD